MANPQNLKKGKDTQFRSGEEAARNGKKGGVASGESRRKKKNIMECASMLMSMRISEKQPKTRKIMQDLGLEDDDLTYGASVVVSLLSKAGKGDVPAARLLMEMTAKSEKQDAEIEDKEEIEDVCFYLPDNGRGDSPSEPKKKTKAKKE